VLFYIFDTGALTAAERGDGWVRRYLDLARTGHATIAIPIVCVLEWWRGRTDVREEVLEAATAILPLTMKIAQAAGVAQAKVKGATAIDAAVMATAALSPGSIVVTRDVHDFARLQSHFKDVRVFGGA